MSQINAGRISASTGFKLPSFTDATRPTTGLEVGFLIFNTDSGAVQVYDGNDWLSISASGSQTFTNAIVFNYTGSDQTLTLPNNNSIKEIIVKCWGAAGGGCAGTNYGGGGGFSIGTVKRSDNATLANNQFVVVVGQGGRGGGTGSSGGSNRTSYGGGGSGSSEGSGGHMSGGGGGCSGLFSGTSQVFNGVTPQNGITARCIIAAGGGGGSNDQNANSANGGCGGGTSGQNGAVVDVPQYNVPGGTQSSGYQQWRGEDGANRGNDNPGGGGGYWGGTAGVADGTGAGGGSGYIGGTTLYTLQNPLTYTGNYPNMAAEAYADLNWVSPVGQGYVSQTNGAQDGGNGRVVILW